MPVAILNAQTGKRLPIYGDVSSIRDWFFVWDHASALLLAVTKGEVGRNYEIAGETNLRT